ncbi:single-stranded DNA-binding protein [Butyrivibrio sp. INlla21]|uniref:single-stranded DNA-binding protein n=1 Tax=Butyrivibrio sp. INlla21 TaxID=1520811 RepID=UPI0008EBDBCD|nr:single-stranded DNA-binding protein [Butyrivibrio sp. INlla21]SFU57748.1 single-strand DNA-binding protein [Butyrivibrio sp. INlla21]
MNKVTLVGRICREIDVRTGQGENSTVARFSIAINRKFKNKEGQYDADFPSVIAFGKTAEFIGKYFTKGMMIGIVGRIQTGSYVNKDGVTVYTTDVVADEAEFVESKTSQNGQHANTAPQVDPSDNFMNVPDEVAEELPFN